MRQSKIGWPQRLQWRLEAFVADLAIALLRALPVDTASAFGGALLRRVGPLTGSHRTAQRNLTLAFPEMGEAERVRVLDGAWDNFGRYIAEMAFMDRLTYASGRVEVVGMEKLEALAKAGEPSVFISGHFSNMEIMSSVILAAGVDCVITGRATNNPYVNERIIESRRRYGVTLYAPKGSDGTRDMLAALKRGQSVALMNDQKNNQGVAAPFFGHICHTATGPTKMALRSSGKLQPLSVTRLKGARFRVTVHDPIVLEQTGDRHADVEAGIRQVNAFVEARVREHPEEWWWMHKRWAKETYEGLKDREANPATSS